MATETGVKDPDSLNGTKTPNPSDEGKIPLAEFDKRVENLKAEYERKHSQAIEDMKQEMEDRLAELEDKANPNRNQQSEADAIRAELRALDANPKAKVWDVRIEEKAAKIAAKMLAERDKEDAIAWVSEKADEIGMTFNDLEGKIMPLIREGRWGNEPLRVRVKKAFKEVNSAMESEKKAEEEKKKGVVRREIGNGNLSERTPSDAVALAKEGKIGDALNSIYRKQIDAQRKM